MNVWLITTGEQLPLNGERPNRTGMLSKTLIDNGHKVAWWTTTFDHQSKDYIKNKDTSITINENFRIIYLHSPIHYSSNVSLRRLINHNIVAKKFSARALMEKSPDLIVCSFPTIDLAYAAVQYGQNFNVKVIIDVRDLWPQIFKAPFPKILHPLINILLTKYTNKSKHAFKNCTNITAVSEKYLQYGLNLGSRVQSELDCVFPLAFQTYSVKNSLRDTIRSKFQKNGLIESKTIIWFVGTFGQTYDLATVIKSLQILNNTNDIQFVFTGDGEQAAQWKLLAKGNTNILFTGWVNRDELSFLSSIANIGLMSYKKGAPQGLPNKLFEYLSAGLPILSSLGGETKSLLIKEGVGLTYKAGNAEDFSKKLITYIENKKLMDKTSERCLALYESRYSSQKVYGELCHYLQTIGRND